MNIIITSLKSVICFVLSLDKVLWPVLGGKRTRWLCVTMALPSPHQGQPLIPACTDEVRAHRLAKSQIHFHLLGETTPSCCETADLQLTHCHVPDNTASLTPVLCVHPAACEAGLSPAKMCLLRFLRTYGMLFSKRKKNCHGISEAMWRTGVWCLIPLPR